MRNTISRVFIDMDTQAFELEFYKYKITGQPMQEKPKQKIFYACGADMHLVIRVYWVDGLLYKIRYFRKLIYDEQMAGFIVRHLENYLRNKFERTTDYSCREFDFHE